MGYDLYNSEKLKKIKIAKKLNLKFDQRDEFEVISDLKKKKITSTNSRSPHKFIRNYIKIEDKNIFPLTNSSGYKTVVTCNENGEWGIFQADRYGFNNPDNLWDLEKIDVALIGDSFVYGACVKQNEDITSHLRKNSKKNIINVGAGGTGTLIQLGNFKEYLKKKKPNKVFLFYFEYNDLSNLKLELTDPILSNYLNKNFSQNLNKIYKSINKNYPTDIYSEKIPNRIYKLFYIRKYIHYAFRQEHAIHDQYLPFTEFEKILETFKHEINEYGGELYFVYLPHYSRYEKKLDINTNNNLFDKKIIKNILNKNQIDLIDIDEEIFRKERNPKIFFNLELDGHYTKEMYKKIAIKISSFLK